MFRTNVPTDLHSIECKMRTMLVWNRLPLELYVCVTCERDYRKFAGSTNAKCNSNSYNYLYDFILFYLTGFPQSIIERDE